jgi:tetratricopeptide (TPR) repeat protein
MPISQTLESAQAHHLEGRLDEAETLYRQVLRAKPDAVAALEGLGVLAYQHGRVHEAEQFFARGVAILPHAPRFHANLGEVYRLLKQPDKAADHLRRAVALDPGLPEAWNSQGLLANDLGRFTEAEAAFREAIRLRPPFVAAHVGLGNALWELDRRAEAIEALRGALSIAPDDPPALANLGRVLMEMDDPELLVEAELHCSRAAALAPQLPATLNNLGNVFRLQNRYEEALACFRNALARDPRRVMPRYNMGQVLQAMGRYDEAARLFEEAEAIEAHPARFHARMGGLATERGDHPLAEWHYRRALAADRGSAEAHHGLGLALLEQGWHDTALAALRDALRIAPKQAAVWVAIGRLQAERGEFDESCHSARTALEIQTKFADAHSLLATNLRGRLPGIELQALGALCDANYLEPRARARLHFALAGVLDARGDFAGAARVLETANALDCAAWSLRGQSYEPGRHSEFIDRLIASFSRDRLERGRGWGNRDPRPIFIVGLPRSGTTLTEQILASHAQIHGAGELPDVQSVFESLPEVVGRPWDDPFAALDALDRAAAQRAARRYLDRLDVLAPTSATRIVDKMPDNIHYLGLIALLWPSAHVIICRRDMRDVAISCWQTGFATIAWANDSDRIARRFADYKRLVDHWRATRPFEWLDVSYEDLVSDLEGQARRLLAFVGLEWDPACLEFATNPRVVRTASMRQVREPVHSRSIGRWRNYDGLVPELFRALKRHGVSLAQEG